MSKSLKRVARALSDAGLPDTIIEAGETRTAEQAAAACGCALDQIVKSILFCGVSSGALRLFLTAGATVSVRKKPLHWRPRTWGVRISVLCAPKLVLPLAASRP